MQADTIVAVIILRKFGEKKFPGVSKAKIEYANKLPGKKTADDLEKAGTVCIDVGGGKFDHHRESREQEKEAVVELVSKYLGIIDDPALDKLISYARRDDLEGKGTISKDPLDRAFGMSGLIQNLNRAYPDEPQQVLDTVAPLFLAHLKEEQKRTIIYPQEYMKKYEEKKVDAFIVKQGKRDVRCVIIESDVIGIIGFLRSHREIQADVIAQKLSSGHVNIITRQWRNVDLENVAVLARFLEAKQKGIEAQIDSHNLRAKGKLGKIPEWYYDTAANTLQNGGMMTDEVKPTQLSLQDIKQAIQIGLNQRVFKEKYPHLVVAKKASSSSESEVIKF